MTTNNLYACVHDPVLLQTVQLELFNPKSPLPTTMARAIMDSGSQQQRYITSQLHDEHELSLPAVGRESHQIKTFGSSVSHNKSCDVVRLGLSTKDDRTLQMTALVPSHFSANQLVWRTLWAP